MNQKAIIIAGSGRSGTTWVQDCIAGANGLRTIFEPLHPIGVPKAGKFSFRYREPTADDPELKRFMDKVLSGNYRSMWMSYRIRPDRFNFLRVGIPNALFNARKLLENYKKYHGQGEQCVIAKFIRANLMLPWIVERYSVKALLVTRHPCAVIASRLKLGGRDWTSQKVLDHYRSDPALEQLIRREFGVSINESVSPIAALTTAWCIENLLPIRWSKEAGYMVSAYENLVLNPDEEWARVTRWLGLSHIPDSSIRIKPSQQASEDMRSKRVSENKLGKWEGVLEPGHIREISTVLDKFSCSIYSVHDDLSKGL